MYLTRFEVNIARRDARALLSSPQSLHAAILSGFPAGSSAAEGGERVLWRLDQDSPQTLLFLTSPGQPDLTHLVESVGWPNTEGWLTRDYSGFLGSLQAGQQWAFRLAANPVRSGKKTDDATRTQRFGHLTAAQQTEWLLARAARCGFVIPVGTGGEPDVAVRRHQVVRFSRKSATVTLSTAVFGGRLEVVDPLALRAALTGGIGPAKGYGCGLMTLARAA